MNAGIKTCNSFPDNNLDNFHKREKIATMAYDNSNSNRIWPLHSICSFSEKIQSEFDIVLKPELRISLEGLERYDSIFKPLSCIPFIQSKINKTEKSSQTINRRTFEFFINNQNNMREYENILSEQYILKPATFPEFMYGGSSPESKAEEEPVGCPVTRSSSSSSSGQNIGSGNEGSDSEKEKARKWLSKRPRDSLASEESKKVKLEVSAPPRKRKNKINRAQELFEDSFVRQTPIPTILSQPTFSINEVYPLDSFQNDLMEIEDDSAHSFMKEHFANMYTRDNFYRHFKLLNEKRNLVLSQHSYPTGRSLQIFSFANSLTASSEISLTLAPKRIWKPLPDSQPILGSN